MSAINWNYDIDKAKESGRIFACLKPVETEGDFDASQYWIGWTQWLEESSRWEMIGEKQEILCWVKPEHPSLPQQF